jgi:hypothetical protein
LLYRKRYSNLIVQFDALAPAIPETITFLNRALTTAFAGNFGGTLALIGAFCIFGIVEAFFFGVVFIKIIYAFNNFFIAGFAALKSFTN